MGNKYKIAGETYSPKKKYSLKIWGKIIAHLQGFNAEDPLTGVVVLLEGDKLDELLDLILQDYKKEELFEEDFEEVGRVISDFFMRKKGLINVGKSSLKK